MICYIDLDSTLVDFCVGLEDWYHIQPKDSSAYDLTLRYGCVLNITGLPPKFWSELPYTTWD